jgi:aldose 1-epimerase
MEFGMAAKIIGNDLCLELWTDAPGFQLYTGNWLDGSCQSKDGKKVYGEYSGFCLEASYPPDSLNSLEWRDKVILKKGKVWKRRDLYKIFKCA